MTAAPYDLRVDGRNEPLGIGFREPEFSWRLAMGPGQTAWEIEVWPTATDGERIWASGRIQGSEPFGVRYTGSPLLSATRYTWRVRVWLGASEPSDWSAPSFFETGLHAPSDWQGTWITGHSPADKHASALYLRGVAELEAEVRWARAYVSSLGWHRFFVNGQDFTGDSLVPRWTPYDHEIEYVTYDVTAALVRGRNILGMAVGDGRFRGTNGFENHRAVYGDRLAGLVQIVAELSDGSTRVIATGPDWSAGAGRITSTDPKIGESADLRVPDEDWLRFPEPPDRFSAALVLPQRRVLIAESVERVRLVDEISPVSVTRLKSGAQVIDFGQNFAGVVKVRLSGESGTEVTLTHSEIRKADGSLDLDYIHPFPWGHWYQRDRVILNGTDQVWNPWFTIHGFRYVEITGLATDLEASDVSGLVLSTDLEYSGDFECSDERLNRLWQNVEWSLRSNFTDTSTDCPTRERSGWTGDIQVFAPTATAYVDARQFLRRYLHNLALEQAPDGTIPVVIPSGYSEFSGGPKGQLKSSGTAAGWGDASVLVPWTLYRYYGDTQVLADQYDSMVAWVKHCADRARDHSSRARRRARITQPEVEQYIVDTGFQFGEWLRPGENAFASVLDARRRGAVVATAYLEHSARTLSRIAAVLGRDEDEQRFAALADNVRRAWRTAFIRPDGRIGTDRQDDYVRALAFDLIDEVERPAATARLIALIHRAKGHIGTGFLSTPLLLDTLVDAGRPDMAWHLLLQTSNPSWLYQIERGATTVWETWEGHTKSGRAKMSHNHFAFGAVARFLTERIAGLTPLEPGYRVIGIRPMIGGGLTSARATIHTPYGPARSSWEVRGEDVVFRITVPPGTRADFAQSQRARVETLEPGDHVIRRSLAELTALADHRSAGG